MVSPLVTFLCFPIRYPSNGKRAQAESAQQSVESNLHYIGVSVGMVEGARLCFEVDSSLV